MKVTSLITLCGLLIGTQVQALSELETELADFQVQLKKDEQSRIQKRPAPRAALAPAPAPAPITYNPGPAPKLGRINRKKLLAKRQSKPVATRPTVKVATQSAPIITHPYEAEPVTAANPPPVSEPAPSPYVQNSDPSNDLSGESVLVARRSSYSPRSAPFIYRLTGMGFATISTFNGADSKSVTSSVQNPYNGGPSGSLTADFNLGSSKWVLEGGFQYLVAGSYTGYDPEYAAYYTGDLSERLTLNYIGAPIHLKYMVSGEYRSSIFLKAGVIPSYLTQSQYDTYAGNLIVQNRFGEFNTFDVLLSAGAGFSLRVWDRAHLVIDGGFYQGVMPISKYFDVFNMGFRVGGGFSYIL